LTALVGADIRAYMRTRRALLAAVGLAAVTLSAPAAATQLRFLETAPGGVVATGNTLGLSKAQGQNGPGLNDSIGTFITLANTIDAVPANPGNPWPAGTTNDWMQNGSTASLALPPDGEVLYAELLWGGSFDYIEDVSAFLDDAVTLSAGGDSLAAVPDPATALTVSELASGFTANYYMRSADVTAFVQTHGTGLYSVEGVPATQSESIESLNAAGWTLVVAYRDTTQPVRNLSVFIGGGFVDEDSQQDYAVSGFCAPPSGIVEGEVILSSIEGDAELTGDQLLIAPTVADPFVNLSGPNNPADNFFCSQLNGDDGLLDMQGSFGGVNHDALLGLTVSGGRQGWDITSVPVSSLDGQLLPAQTSAVIRTITTGDSYMPTLAAFEIDVNAPNFAEGNSTTLTDLEVVMIGDTLTVTVALDNVGQAQANGLTFRMPLESGLALSSFTMDGAPGDISGNPVMAADLTSGVDAGDLAPNGQREVVVEVEVIAPPDGSAFLFQPTWDYDFVVCAGDAPEGETFSGELVFVDFEADVSAGGAGGLGGAGAAGGAAAGGQGGDGINVVGGSGTGGQAAAGNASSGTAGASDADQDGGCGCAIPGEPSEDRARLFALLAMAGFVAAARVSRRRVRRRSRC
jgi:uncharacterized repeat protein (TIGR01451 family)